MIFEKLSNLLVETLTEARNLATLYREQREQLENDLLGGRVSKVEFQEELFALQSNFNDLAKKAIQRLKMEIEELESSTKQKQERKEVKNAKNADRA